MLFTFPSRYWFTIGHARVLRLGGWSPHVQAGFHVSRPTQGQKEELRIRGYHPLWPDFPFRFANNTAKEYKADPISLATTLGISVDFCSCSYLDVSVHCVRFPCLCIQQGMTHSGRVSPFGYLRIKARLPAPRSFSQATTSFIACNRQGIHHMHLFA